VPFATDRAAGYEQRICGHASVICQQPNGKWQVKDHAVGQL
jgi:hypothetical protein